MELKTNYYQLFMEKNKNQLFMELIIDNYQLFMEEHKDQLFMELIISTAYGNIRTNCLWNL